MKNTFTRLIALAIVLMVTTPLFAQISFQSNIVDIPHNLIHGAQVVHAIDLDGDGDTDIISGSGEGHLDWYVNDGSQQFEQKMISVHLDEVRSISAIDFDNDGDVDILIATGDDNHARSGSKVVIYQNNGEEIFTPHVIEARSEAYYSAVIPYDMDLDGDLDIVFSTRNYNEILWAEQDSSYSFTVHTAGTVPGPTSLYVTDIDLDGDVDIITDSNDDVVILRNQGENSFLSEDISFSNLSGIRSVYGHDFTGDGYEDILVGARYGLYIYGNRGDSLGTFYKKQILAGVHLKYAIPINVDDDNQTDVLLSTYDDEVYLLKNDGELSFTSHLVSADLVDVRNVFTADVDQDGDFDLLSASNRDNKISWYENKGTTTFNQTVVTSGPEEVSDVYTGDINLDGELDVVSSTYDGELYWHENIGEEEYVRHIIKIGDVPFFVINVADYDSDGDLDVSASMWDENEVAKIVWYANDGAGNFTEKNITHASGGSVALFSVDLDNDGTKDILSAASIAGEITWYQNIGAGTFTKKTIGSSFPGARNMSAVDLDADGDLDVVATSTVDAKIIWFENDGAMNFSQHILFEVAVQTGAQAISPVDIDADNDIDLIISTSSWLYGSSLLILYNDGDQNYTYTIVPSDGGSIGRQIVTGDIDDDGDVDIASAVYGEDEVSWFENISGEFTEHVITFDADGANAVFMDDVDSDGDLDILSASSNNSEVAWYKNSLIDDTAIEEYNQPATFVLSQNYPNPFAGVSTISYTLPAVSNVQLVIYNQLGQKVMTLVNAVQAGGTYELSWDGKDQNGVSLASGVYLYRLETNNFFETRKMILVR